MITHDSNQDSAAADGKGGGSSRHHIVVVRPPYLEALLAGRKQVECRLSKLRRPPFESCAPGDLLWFKLPSRAICAFGVAGRCEFRRLVRGGELAAVVTLQAARICAEPGFFEDASRWARYVSLIEIRSIVRIRPMMVSKSDQRGWVVLDRLPFPGMAIGRQGNRPRGPARQAGI